MTYHSSLITPSGSESVEHPRERDGLADVLDAAHPCDAALDAHAEARVRDAAVAAQVEIPLERLARQVVFLELFFEEFERGGALAAADDLAVALGREDVHAERQLVALGVALHVEGFDGRRVAVNHDGLVEATRNVRLVGRAEVAAPLEALSHLAALVTLVE